jgi:hypothetical protein
MRHCVERRSLHSIVVGLCLTALLVASGVEAASLVAAGFPEAEALVAPTIRFDPSSSTVSTGATLGVNIVVDNAADLGGFEFTMTFDPAVVTAVTVTLGSFLGSTGRSVGAVTPIIDNTMGTVKYAAFSMGTGPGPDDTGTLAVVTLQAVAAGSTGLNFSQAQLTDTQWYPMTVVTPSISAGTVTVSAGILGDVNGDGLVDSTDALIILSADVGVNTSQFCPMDCGDANADGYIDSTDALIILSYDVGKAVPFPIGQPGCPSSVTQPPGCTP